MSRSNAHPLRLNRHLTKWVTGAIVVALIAWLFEFSTHNHFADADGDDGGSPGVVHLCGYCAGMQAGAGPVTVVFQITPPSTAHVEPIADESFSSTSAPAPYRSRAPPAA
jgi:hypothetical protein